MNEATYRVLLECVDLLDPSSDGPEEIVLIKLVDLIVAYENEHRLVSLLPTVGVK
jgi:hypothetical protein